MQGCNSCLLVMAIDCNSLHHLKRHLIFRLQLCSGLHKMSISNIHLSCCAIIKHSCSVVDSIKNKIELWVFHYWTNWFCTWHADSLIMTKERYLMGERNYCSLKLRKLIEEFQPFYALCFFVCISYAMFLFVYVWSLNLLVFVECIHICKSKYFKVM